jgi:uncharacterized protein (DUF1015 family)
MRRALPGASPDAAYNFCLALVTSARDPNLRIFPTHRLISGLDQAVRANLREQMAECFDLEQHRLSESMSAKSGGEIRSWLDGVPRERHVFAAYYGGGTYCTLVAREDMLPEAASVVDALDVSVLHQALIDPLISDPAALCDPTAEIAHDAHATGVAAAGARLTYTTDEREAIAAVDRADYDCAFFLRATQISEVIAAARAGKRMPGKSTYFYPKVPAGIVLSDASEKPV